MSHDIRLVSRTLGGEVTCKVVPHEEGGTYAMGGTADADLNVTYNYSQVYAILDFHPSELNDKRAGDCIPRLEEIVAKLGTRQYSDYWAPTPGNAGHAMNVVLGWCKQNPDAIVRVTP